MKFSHFLLCGLGALTLTACEKTKEQFDFSKKAPDEFAVTTRAPLEMPPQIGELPSPRPGAPRPQERATDTQARQAIFGEDAIAATAGPDNTISKGENALLERTGAFQSNQDIRNQIDAETEQLAKENISTFDKILGKTGKKIDAPTTVVDPIKESERIMINREAGNPVTQGETPTVKQ